MGGGAEGADGGEPHHAVALQRLEGGAHQGVDAQAVEPESRQGGAAERAGRRSDYELVGGGGITLIIF